MFFLTVSQWHISLKRRLEPGLGKTIFLNFVFRSTMLLQAKGKNRSSCNRVKVNY